MSLHTVWQKSLDFHPGRPIVVEPTDAKLSSDVGLLASRQFDEQIGLSQRLVEAIAHCDTRDQARLTHSMSDLLRQRLFGILAGYEDQNDHDRLRHDPILQLVCGRLPQQLDDNGVDPSALGSQPTMSLFENRINVQALWNLRDALIEQWLDGYEQPPTRITLDVDAFDDPAHGQQQLTLFRGYYGHVPGSP